MIRNKKWIYYSMGGINHQLAKWAEEGATEVGAEVKVLKVPELAPQSVIEGMDDWNGQMQLFSVCQLDLEICLHK